MKQLFVLALLASVAFFWTGCKSYRWMDTAQNEKSLVGLIQRSQLNTDQFPWFKANYTAYNSAQSTDILYLRGYNKRVTFIVFAGTWCDDTHLLLPRFYRVLDEAQFTDKSVTLYGVDRQKKTLKGESEKYGITNVPTIIILNDGKEVGRIVETVKRSVEVDLKNILVKVLN